MHFNTLVASVSRTTSQTGLFFQPACNGSGKVDFLVQELCRISTNTIKLKNEDNVRDIQPLVVTNELKKAGTHEHEFDIIKE